MARAILSPQAKDLALKSVFGGDVFVRLTRSGREIEDEGYSPQGFHIGTPGSLEEGVRAVANAAQIRFGPWRQDVAPITGWIIMSANEVVLARGDFEEERQPRRGDEMAIHAGNLVLGLQ